MSTRPGQRPALRRGAALASVWLAVTLAVLALVGTVRYLQVEAGFETEARTLHRVVSQRADQHDAHLTSLAAILASPDRSAATLPAVADALMRFYPRVVAIDAVALAPAPAIVWTTREGAPSRDALEGIAAAARALRPGGAGLAPGEASAAGEAFTLVKRLPPGPSGAEALVMVVDGRRLTEPDASLPPGTALTLSEPSGRAIVAATAAPASSGLLPPLSFAKALGSRSQPLVLGLVRQPSAAEVLPPLALASAGGASALVVGLGWGLVRARRMARLAAERARFHAHELRLAHAMRVNTLGEMASGIAHELTQPLTALLSRSQAGLHLARSGRSGSTELLDTLEANVRLAKRAGDILSRLRAYISNRAPTPEPTGLNDLVRNAVGLASADLERRGLRVALRLSRDEPAALVDRVSIEQVVHNLVRNAADALDAATPHGATSLQPLIEVATALEKGEAVITVADRGPGVSPENLPRLFEPFFTTKAEGLGLGLPLCERLVERFGGRIAAANAPDGGAVFTVRLPALERPARAAA